MRRTAGMLLAILPMVHLGGPACASAQPFETLPPGDSAYRSIQELERAGYFTGSPEGTFSGAPPRTRYEFAVAVERIFRGLQPRVLAAVEPGSLPEELKLVRDLLAQFTEDIGSLGLDVRELRRQLDAMDERVMRMQRPRGRRPTERQALPPAALGPTPLEDVAPFGVRTKLREGLMATWLARLYGAEPRTGVSRLPGATVRPGVAARLGPALLGLEVTTQPSTTSAAGLPLSSPDSHRRFGASLNLPLGSYLVSAFFARTGEEADPFRQTPLLPVGAALEGYGAQVAGPLVGRVAIELEGGSLAALGLTDDLARVNYVRGGFNYAIGRYRIETGYERYRQLGLLGGVSSGYYLGLGRSFGQAQLNAVLRGGDASSAVGQVSIRF